MTPANGTIIEVINEPSSFSVIIVHSCTLYSQISGLKSLNFDRFPETVVGGQTIGRINALNRARWRLIDTNRTGANIVVPSHYEFQNRGLIYATDPLLHMVNGSTAYADVLARSVRQSPPVLGQQDFDKSGTLSGMWFIPSAQGDRSLGYNPPRFSQLAFVPNNFDPSVWQAAGFWQSGNNPEAVVISGNTPNPGTVSVGQTVSFTFVQTMYTYPNGTLWDNQLTNLGITLKTDGTELNGCLLVELMTATTLRAEFFGFTNNCTSFNFPTQFAR